MADQNEPQTPQRPALERVKTGIPGLDEVLQGGFLRGASCLISGKPGTGKTTIGNQFAYHIAANDGVALYVTIVAEAHDRMLMHLGSFDFFDPEVVGQRVHYFSLVNHLTEQGLAGGLSEIRRLVRAHGASLLVIDGAARFEDFAASPPEFFAFVGQLIAELAIFDCTTVLLVQPNHTGEAPHSIESLVDGILVLEDRSFEMRDSRLLRLTKLRGSSTLRGWHEFAITNSGIEVYPRLESSPGAVKQERPARQRRLPLGIDGLDTMLQGGLLTGSTTLVAGPSGIGKTTLGLHFIVEGVERGEQGLIASFGEAPERLMSKADGLGLSLRHDIEASQVHMVWQPMPTPPLDAWAGTIVASVMEHRPQRLVIDGLTELAQLTPFPDRLPAFLTALGHFLRTHGVTAIVTAETSTAEAADLEIPFPDAVATLDNVILLRYVEPRSRLHRLMSVLRVRESGFDSTVREFTIMDRGIEVASTGSSAESVLADVARLPVSSGSGEGGDHPTGDDHDHAGGTTSEDSGRR
ncbi:MAG: AAA family ATPase [Chloroflexia bacterium]|nr:AAA family ATPase [Chloroflexia bacterium]